MCNNGYSMEKRRYFGMLGDIAGEVLEGKNLVDAAAKKGMTAEEFKNALSTDVRKENFLAYMRISQALMTEEEYLSLLEKEFLTDVTSESDSQQMIDAYIAYTLEFVGNEEAFKKHLESKIRFNNYRAYVMIAQKRGYQRLAP